MAKFFRDENGFPRAELDSPNEMLGWYLEQDVQSSAATCDELLVICEEVTSGTRSDYSGIGNAHTLTIDANGVVTIENEFADDAEPCEVSISEFSTALLSWKVLIER